MADNRMHYKQYMWVEIKGFKAGRFARNKWKNRERTPGQQEWPIETMFNGQDVIIWSGKMYRKDEHVGSRTVTPEQIANRPPAVTVKVKANSPRYAPVHEWKRRE